MSTRPRRAARALGFLSASACLLIAGLASAQPEQALPTYLVHGAAALSALATFAVLRSSQRPWLPGLVALALLILLLASGFGAGEELGDRRPSSTEIAAHMILGAALLTATRLRSQRSPWPRLLLCLGGAFVTLLAGSALLGALLGFESLLDWGTRVPIPLPRAAILASLGLAVLFAGLGASTSEGSARGALLIGLGVTLVSAVFFLGLLRQGREQLSDRLSGTAKRLEYELDELVATREGALRTASLRLQTTSAFGLTLEERFKIVSAEVFEERRLDTLDLYSSDGTHLMDAATDALPGLSGRSAGDTLGSAELLRQAGPASSKDRSCLLRDPKGRPFLAVSLRIGDDRVLIGTSELSEALERKQKREDEVGTLFGVYRGEEPYSKTSRPRLTATLQWGHPLPLPFMGPDTTLRVYPTTRRLELAASPFPGLILFIAFSLCLVTTALAQAAESDRHRVEQLEVANLALGREVQLRELAEAEAQERNQRLLRVTKRLGRSNEDLERFAYVAAHDLRSPLRAIRTITDWLAEDMTEAGLDLTDEIKENFELLQRRVGRMEDLLESLLAYSRAGRQELALAEIDTRELIEGVWALLQPVESTHELVIEGELPTLTSARAPFETLFGNLFSNSLKHHDRDSVRIEVSCEDQGDAYRFCVRDDGPGIPPEYHAQIFGLFRTLKTRDEVEGSGMGLAIARRYVQRVGGEIELVSDPNQGRGTTFLITWPKEYSEEMDS